MKRANYKVKNILFIGNKLKNENATVSMMEFLTEKLSSFVYVNSASGEKNKVLRMIDMIRSVYFHRNKLDLVLIDTFSTSAFYFALVIGLLCKILKIKYIPIIHGGNIEFRLNKYPRLSNMLFKNATINISPSIFIFEVFKKFDYQVQFLPNSIDLKSYNFKERSALSPKLLWVRSFHELYNPQMAIEVVRVLKKDYKNIKLCMVGPDKDGSIQKCKNLANKYGLKRNVSFTGLLDRFDWINLSEDYDIFINTTNVDNMPLSVIEAMALGFPVISTNAGGLKFLHEDGHDALLGDKKDVNKMVSNIKLILKDRSLAQGLSKNARIKAEKYDWEKYIRHHWFDLINQH